MKNALISLREKFSTSDDEVVKNHKRSGLFLALVLVIPLVTIVSTHIFFRSFYTAGVFHLQGFQQEYYHGIYRYRILGRGLVLFVYHLFLSHGHDQLMPMPRDSQGTLFFYASYVLITAVFFFLSNLLLLILLWDWNKGISDARLSQYFFLILLWALSTATVTPYDQIAYFFMLLALLSVNVRSSWLMYLILAVAAVAGGLDRETQFLATPALWTVAICTRSAESRRYFRAGLFHLICFSACYFALRIFISGDRSISGSLTFGGFWAAPSFCILVSLFCIGVYLCLREYASKLPSIGLLILSVPYLLTILLTGQLRELRLIIPLLIGLFFTYAQLVRLREEQQLSDNLPCGEGVHAALKFRVNP